MAEAKVEIKAETTAPKPKKKLLMFIIIGVVALVILVGGGIGAFLMLGSSDPTAEGATTDTAHGTTPDKKADKKKTDSGHGKAPIFEKLPQFTVNVNSDAGEVMQTDIVIELPDVKVQGEVKALMPKIQSSINKLLSAKKPEEVKTTSGREKLEVEIKELVNRTIEAEGEHGVISVNFITFIVR